MPDRDSLIGDDLRREMRRAPRPNDAARAHVMRAVRKDASRPGFAFIRRWRGERPGWMSPMLGLSLAATMLLGAAIGTRFDFRPSEQSASAGAMTAAIRDTLMLVRFALYSPGAGTVALVGDFNAWRRNDILLRREGTQGTWVANVPLARGEHRYAFVIDDTAWVPDATTPARGRVSSRVVVPTP